MCLCRKTVYGIVDLIGCTIGNTILSTSLLIPIVILPLPLPPLHLITFSTFLSSHNSIISTIPSHTSPQGSGQYWGLFHRYTDHLPCHSLATRLPFNSLFSRTFNWVFYHLVYNTNTLGAIFLHSIRCITWKYLCDRKIVQLCDGFVQWNPW